MPKTIETREEAIQYLLERGHEASIHDWVMGQTVRVPFGQKQEIELGEQKLMLWPGCLHIYSKEGGWAILNSNPRQQHSWVYASLHDATLAAEAFVEKVNKSPKSTLEG